MTTTNTGSLVATKRRRNWWQQLGYLVRRALVMEVRCYQSIYRLIFRRPRVPARAVGFSYHQPVLPILIVFLAVSVVELVVVDLIVHRWTHIRIPFLILGAWGVVWMFGLLCGMLVRPHAVGPDGIRVRSGPEIDLRVSWDDIYAVSRRKRTRKDREPKITVDDDGSATLHLWIGDETNLELSLERPTEFRLPQGPVTVSRIALYAEDSLGFLIEVRRHIG